MDDYLALIKSFEGYSPRPYGDYKQTSIGYGTRAQPGDAYLSRDEADARLRAEAAKVTAFLDSRLPGIDDTKKAALTSFGYNLGTGEGGLSDLIPDAKAGNWTAVADRMKHYNHAGGEVNDGLTQRRAQEASILTGGAMPNAAQLTAETLRKRFSRPKSEPQVIQQAAPDRAQTGGDTSWLDKLVGALAGGGGNPKSRLDEANSLINAGRSAPIASPWGLVGSLAQQGVGQYMKGNAEDELKASNDEFAKSLSGAGDIATLARVMIASGDPKYQAAGAELLAKALQPAKPAGPIELSPGATLYDAAAGKAVYTAPSQAKPVEQSELERRAIAGGLQPGTPQFQEYMLKGGERPLTVTDKRAILAAEEALGTNKNVIGILDQALALNKSAYSGLGASTRGYFSSLVGDQAGIDTQNLENMVQTQAINQLKAIFGGMPTEGERKILLELQGSVNQAPEVRAEIWTRAKGLAEKRLSLNEDQVNQLRGGTFFKPGGGQSGAASEMGTLPKTAPAAGDVEGGYRFIGGDPAKPESWEKI